MKCKCGLEFKDELVNFKTHESGIIVFINCEKCHRVYFSSLESKDFNCIFENHTQIITEALIEVWNKLYPETPIVSGKLQKNRV